jgi:hypothetical protein
MSTANSYLRPSESRTAEISTSIFALIHTLHSTITDAIDTSLTWDQLNSPPVNYTLVRPIVDRSAPRVDTKKANTDHLSVPGNVERGETAEAGSKGNIAEISLGGVLYALMANR